MPERNRSTEAEDYSNRSGERRLAHDIRVDETLPPTPQVVAKRPRIVTGRYAVVTPSQQRRDRFAGGGSS